MSRPHTGRLALALAALCLLAFRGSPALSQEGGIEVFAAETLFDQGFRISQSHLYQRSGELYSGSSRIGDAQDRVFQEHRSVTGIDYGILPGLTLSALLPVVYKQQEQLSGGGRETLESSGLGDIAFLGKYRIYKRDWKRGAFHFTAISGLEMPTGATNERHDGARLSPSLQPGSGSWDPFAALSTNLGLDRLRFDGLLFFKANTEGSQDFADGDFFAAEVDAAYRFWHTKYPGPTASARLGVQWRHQERAEANDRGIANSGSDETILRAGLTFHPVPSMDLTLSVDVPVYRDLNGQQLGRDFRTFLALGFRF